MKIIDIDNTIAEEITGDKIFKNNISSFYYYTKDNRCIIKRDDKDNGWSNDLYLKVKLNINLNGTTTN